RCWAGAKAFVVQLPQRTRSRRKTMTEQTRKLAPAAREIEGSWSVNLKKDRSGGLGRLLVQPGAAKLTHRLNRAHVAKAIRHSLGDPAFDAEPFCKVACVERPRQSCRQQFAQVGGRAKFVDADDFHEPLVLDDVVVVAPPP